MAMRMCWNLNPHPKLVGMWNGTTTLEISSALLKKWNTHPGCDQPSHSSVLTQRSGRRWCLTKNWTQMFTAAQADLAPHWNQPKSPSAGVGTCNCGLSIQGVCAGNELGAGEFINSSAEWGGREAEQRQLCVRDVCDGLRGSESGNLTLIY